MSSGGDHQTTEESTDKLRFFFNAYIFTKLGSYYVLISLYLLLGGLIFHLVEGYNEQEERDEATRELDNLNSTVRLFLTSVNFTNTTFSSQQLSVFASYIVELSRNVSSLNSIVNQTPKWTYGRSVYFSFIALSTIGYGQLAPTTRLGQSLLCIYAFLGIPIFILLITDTSRRLTDAFDWCVLRRVRKEQVRWIAIVIALIIGVVALILIPAAIFGSIEGWGYASSTYFCFVSLSTIGFGDLVIGNNPDASYDVSPAVRELYVLSSLIWLFLGLVFIAILVAQIGTGIKKLENRISGIFKRFTMRKYDLKDKDDTVKIRKETKIELLPASNPSP